MRITFSLLLCLCNLFYSTGQNDIFNQSPESIAVEFYQYNVVYPEQAVENNIEGTVILMFDVDSTCSFVNRTQNNKLGYGCDEISWETLDKFELDFKIKNNNKCQASSGIIIPVLFSLTYD